MNSFAYLTIAFGLAVWSAPARAQTVPSFAAPAESRPDFSGTWTLDGSISNDPSQATFEAGRDESSPQTGRGGGFGGGSGRRRGGGGFGGSRPGNRDTAPGITATEQTRLRELTEQLKHGSATLVISHHDPSFVINDAQDHTEFFRTNGTSDEHPFPSGTIPGTAHWDGSRLVTEYTLSSRRKLVYTYTLLPNTKQLVLRVNLDRGEGQRANGRELKLVYNEESADTHRK